MIVLWTRGVCLWRCVLCDRHSGSQERERFADAEKMIDKKASMKLSEHCSNVCETLKTKTQGRNTDDIEESVRMGPGNLERCAN